MGSAEDERDTRALDALRESEEKLRLAVQTAVLVVDDEPVIRSAVSEILGDAGFEAKSVASGEEAVELLADARTAAAVRVVLLDVSMPGMPSRDLRARLRALAPNARVVYFTGYAFDPADAEDAVLEKPATRDQLLDAIRKVLGR